jgi:Domain of unknown function (DUF4598)
VRSRLDQFLPALRNANADLEANPDQLQARNLESVEEGEQYIEMNLGLGVLEEKTAGVTDTETDSSSDESSSSEEDRPSEDTDEMDGVQRRRTKDSRRKRKVETDIMGRLLGRRRTERRRGGEKKVVIQEVGDG